MLAFRPTPLCPAGHLPLKGGDWMSLRPSPITDVAGWATRSKLPISPLEGEMAGRPEGGAWAPCLS
ncbi:MAG: lytic murein transglycosylase [Mesorhizobium sp.]|nr:MAG: lytic murein transglycosylase [Mesorhizobium sp.]